MRYLEEDGVTMRMQTHCHWWMLAGYAVVLVLCSATSAFADSVATERAVTARIQREIDERFRAGGGVVRITKGARLR